jgi:hypothetical protein
MPITHTSRPRHLDHLRANQPSLKAIALLLGRCRVSDWALSAASAPTSSTTNIVIR